MPTCSLWRFSLEAYRRHLPPPPSQNPGAFDYPNGIATAAPLGFCGGRLPVDRG
jgi:hypothetical protein